MSSLLVAVKSHLFSKFIHLNWEIGKRQSLAVGTWERGEVAAVNHGGRVIGERGEVAAVIQSW